MAAPDIEHVVVLMLENRSFDHLLGLLPGGATNGLFGANGQIDPAFANAVTGFANPIAAAAGADYTIAAEQIDKKGFGGPGHSYPDATQQVYGSRVAPNPLPAQTMAGFAQSYHDQLVGDVRIANPTQAQVQVPMLAFTPAALPVLSTLAQEFCVCDQWHCEVPGPTQPNRLFVHAATAAGFAHNVWSHPFTNETIYEALEKAGRDWAVFYFDLRDTDSYPAIKKRAQVEPFAAFYGHVSAGSLPAYSFLCPRYNESKVAGADPPNSQHAPYDVRNGEELIADVYEALRAGPLWGKTALIITYDENGGYYDHVTPPTDAAAPGADTSPTQTDQADAARNEKAYGYLLKPDYVFDFTRLGPRVPTVVVSPLIPKGTVARQRLQHTSIFATLRDIYGVGALTARDAQAGSFTDVFSLAQPRDDAPTTLLRPPAAAPLVNTLAAPLTHQQVEMWPLLSQLDGHPDSGRTTPPPATRGEAADYIQARIAAHNTYHRQRRRKAAYEIARGADGLYAWRLVDEHGHEIARAAHGYADAKQAEHHIAALRDLAPFARQTSAPAAAGGG